MHSLIPPICLFCYLKLKPSAGFANTTVILKLLREGRMAYKVRISPVTQILFHKHLHLRVWLMLFTQMWLGALSQAWCRQPICKASFTALPVHLNPDFLAIPCAISVLDVLPTMVITRHIDRYVFIHSSMCLPSCATFLFQPRLPKWSANVTQICSTAYHWT